MLQIKMSPTVVSVSRDETHRFSKTPVSSIMLIEGIGVEGDSHAGETVQHRSRVAVNPAAPNLRQIHLIAAELLDELNEKGFDIKPSDLGENITTKGIDLLTLPKGAVLEIGDDAAIEITGLRNPCAQIEKFRTGLLKEALREGPGGVIEKRAGIMGIVRRGGTIRPGDGVAVRPPAGPRIPLEGV